MPTGISGHFNNTKGARYQKYWNDIPVGRANAVTYEVLCAAWGCDRRQARKILHDLSHYDNGDKYILIRSSGCKGFYKTDDETEILAYKRECLNKGRSVFAPVKKINRVLNANACQYNFANNLRFVRVSRGMKQIDVCRLMKKHDKAFDKSLLSKLENSVVLPTPYQIFLLAQIYGVEPIELLDVNLYC